MLFLVAKRAGWRTVDVILGAAVLVVALSRHGATVGMGQALGFGATLLFGMAIVYSFFLIMATLAFWFIRIENILVIFGDDIGMWNISAYHRGMMGGNTIRPLQGSNPPLSSLGKEWR